MAYSNAESFGCFSVVAKFQAEGFKMFVGNCFVHSESTLADIRLTSQAEIHSCAKKNFGHDSDMFPINDPELFERTFINVVADIIDASPALNHSVFAKAVWGDDQKEVNKWRRIRNKSKEGKPQKLLLSDAVRMTQVLQVDFASFTWEVTKHIEMAQKNTTHSLPKRTALPA